MKSRNDGVIPVHHTWSSHGILLMLGLGIEDQVDFHAYPWRIFNTALKVSLPRDKPGVNQVRVTTFSWVNDLITSGELLTSHFCITIRGLIDGFLHDAPLRIWKQSVWSHTISLPRMRWLTECPATQHFLQLPYFRLCVLPKSYQFPRFFVVLLWPTHEYFLLIGFFFLNIPFLRPTHTVDWPGTYVSLTPKHTMFRPRHTVPPGHAYVPFEWKQLMPVKKVLCLFSLTQDDSGVLRIKRNFYRACLVGQSGHLQLLTIGFQTCHKPI